MFLREYVNKINEKFSALITGMKVFGLAQPIVRTVGNQEELLPGVVDIKGEVTYVGIDDTDPVRLYHKNAGVVTAFSGAQKGYGDNFNDIVNTYQMALIVFVNKKRTKLYPEELFLFLQSNLLDEIKVEPYKRVLIRTTNVILNSQQVFKAEYAGPEFRLPEHLSLFQINYVIESTFEKECFAKCPEDC